MRSPSNRPKTIEEGRRDYGFARARDVAFDAVQTLWHRRRNQGVKQTDIATFLGRDPAWVNRKMRGPGNWTLRTIGELVEALDGEIEINVYGMEDFVSPKPNFHAYAGYEPPPHALPTGNPNLPTSAIAANSTPPIVQDLLRSMMLNKPSSSRGL